MHDRMIALGNTESGETSLNLDVLLRTRLFLSATSGGGKSEAIRYMLEQLVPHVQCLVLDPEGEFATLREKHPFVLVGEGGETPAHPKTAAQVALTLLRERASAVCDLYELKGNGRHEFIANFIAAIVDAPKDLWHPVVIIIDEAHTFAPENGYGESVAKQPIIDLANLGRKRGFCLVLATQRASKISKNAIEPCQNRMIGLTQPEDQKRVCEMFKVAPGPATREFSILLENLEPGQYWSRGPAISKTAVMVHMPRAATKAPKTGSAAAAKRTPTPESIKHLLPSLLDIPQEVERKARTEEDMRREIKDLKRTVADLERVNANRPSMSEDKLKEIEMLSQKLEELAGSIGQIETQVAQYKEQMAKARELAQSLVGVLSDQEIDRVATDFLRPTEQKIRSAVKAALPSAAPKPAIPTAARTASPRKALPDGEPLSGPEQRIVDSIAWFHAIGIEAPEQPAVAFMAGYTHGAGGYNNPRGRLNQRGLVTYMQGDKIALTEAGKAAANTPDVPGTDEALHQAVLAKLGGPEQRILTPLLAAFPAGMTNTDLAAAAGYTAGAGGYNNPRGRLKSLGLVEYREGQVFARDILFPEAR